ncbi:plasmid partitioning protein RepB [Palleronia caenipelagi]|uniref:Plasmid partitioning protein RepB n=1 Tax=Palleronia caenipelagi TaxID=2489174 RepID=A0A547PUG5_9RHOB|nr:plasmid partitioning protein RepB [Palleronia caenipelagi]TRD17789.1 plasmid partitioning protein RepB [Palleronia caenipelagi]
MTTGRKKRLSMLDSLSAAEAPAPAPTGSMVSSNRALRSARNAVDAHHVWELDPDTILDDRLADRLDPRDVIDLRDAIEANGQTVPILVRRHPSEADRYLLVYGRRRLEAIRLSEKVDKVRALVASLDDDHALRAQISENMARRDLSYIEKALFAQELVQNGFGTQSQVAEVLTVTKSSISMALSVVEAVGVDLIRMIGAAHGIGRPRWETLGREMEQSSADRDGLIRIAEDVFTAADVARARGEANEDPADTSRHAFEAVAKAVTQTLRRQTPAPAAKSKSRALVLDGARSGAVSRGAKGLTIRVDDSAFADWLDAEVEEILAELHGRWKQRAEE